MTTTAADRAMLGYALAQHEGKAFGFLGMLQIVKIGQEDTGARCGLIEIVVPPGIGNEVE